MVTKQKKTGDVIIWRIVCKRERDRDIGYMQRENKGYLEQKEQNVWV